MASQLLPSAVTRLIDEFTKLPGVGTRTAERFAYSILKSSANSNLDFANAIKNTNSQVKLCPVTFALIDSDDGLSPLYTDEARDKQTVIVVEEPLDIVSIEKTGQFSGTYHVIGGVISPIDGVTADKLHIRELIERIKTDDVKELIIATNASVEGESTSLFIQKQIKDNALDVKMTRLARGLPIGVDLEYADQITLGHALAGRKEID